MTGKIFTGEEAQQMEQTVIDTVKTFLGTSLAAPPYAARLARWGGVKITDTDKDMERFIAAAKPIIFIRIPDGSHDRSLFRHKIDGEVHFGAHHIIDIMLELVVTERCQDAIKPLRDAVQSLIGAGYFALRDLGLMNTKISAGGTNISGAQLIHPHTLHVECLGV